MVKKEEGDKADSDGVCLPKLPLLMTKSCFSRDGWTPACPLKEVNEFLVFSLHMKHLLSLLTCLYFSHLVFSFSLFWFSPSGTREGKQTSAWSSVAGCIWNTAHEFLWKVLHNSMEHKMVKSTRSFAPNLLNQKWGQLESIWVCVIVPALSKCETAWEFYLELVLDMKQTKGVPFISCINN